MMLGAKASAKRQAKDDGDDRVSRSISASAVMTVRDAAIVMARRPFAGLGLSDVVGRVERVCERFVPEALAGSAENLKSVVAYALWRFTSASADAFARAAKLTEDNLDRVLRRMRVGRQNEPATERLLWSIEWALRWTLMAAPHRP